MTEIRTRRGRGMAALAGLAMVAALLVPVTLTLAASPAASDGNCNTTTETTRGVTQGGIGECCPNGEFGHWEWGGQGGQNLYWCDADPYSPPPTAAPATAAPAVAPKQAAPAAKPIFTG
jgi:hypothetical protein